MQTQLIVPLKLDGNVTKINFEGQWEPLRICSQKAFRLNSPYLLKEGNYFLRDHEDLMTAEQFPHYLPEGVEESDDGILIVGFLVEKEVDELEEEEEED